MAMDFRRFFESIPWPMAILGPDFRIVAVTDAAVRGAMRTREELIGRVLYEAFPDNPGDPSVASVNNLRASLERVKRDRVTDYMGIVRHDIQQPDGTFVERHWRSSNTPVLDHAGELINIMHAVEDVTEIVRLQKLEAAEHQQVIETNRALEAANEELEAFCYSVAHDLRAPLRGIQGFSQAVLEEHSTGMDEQGQSYLKRVAAAAVRMSELIDDLLTLSRISRSTLTRVPVDVSEIATRVAAELDRQSDRRVSFTIAAGMTAVADPRLLQIVFENLLGNAWKFTGPSAAPRVQVGSMIDRGETAFYVRDNGAGFDQAHAPRLFAPFQRLHSDKEFAGTGIGLATVQRIVRRHGGRVWAAGDVQRGATFFFTLPD